MNRKLKAATIGLGALASVLLVSQLIMGLLIVRGGGGIDRAKLVKIHQHSGYTTVPLSLLYVGLSLATIAGLPARNRN